MIYKKDENYNVPQADHEKFFFSNTASKNTKLSLIYNYYNA